MKSMTAIEIVDCAGWVLVTGIIAIINLMFNISIVHLISYTY